MLEPIPILRIPPCPVDEFYRTYVRGSYPVVFKGLVDTWPAMKLWNFNYFIENFSQVEAEVLPIKAGKGYVNPDAGVSLRSTPLGVSLSSISQNRLDDALTITSPVDIFPELFHADYIIPDYCRDKKYLTSRIFIGPKGMVTPMHQDLYENLYVMVKGKKTITLFAPAAPVYPCSRFSKRPNFSQVDIEAPDYKFFPRLKRAQPFTVELEAGETLFIPSFWWHHVRTGEPSIAINFWWAYGWKLPIAWAGNTYARWRKIGNYSALNKS
jgi:hypothetical protein